FQKGVDSLQGAEMFLSGSTYTLKYHFPRRVKSTTLEGATSSADGRTLNYEIELLAWMKDPSLLDLEVVLEDYIPTSGSYLCTMNRTAHLQDLRHRDYKKSWNYKESRFRYNL